MNPPQVYMCEGWNGKGGGRRVQNGEHMNESLKEKEIW